MKTITKTAAIALAASTMAVATPASAAIFEYEMTNGDILTINNETGTGTWKGAKIDVTFEGSDLKNFQGGAKPTFKGTLTNLTGLRNINGTDFTPTRQNGNRFHPWMLKTMGDGNINLWSWWGNPVIAGDYVKKVGDFRTVDVPAPGMLGLFGLALVALGLGRRRRIKAAAAAA